MSRATILAVDSRYGSVFHLSRLNEGFAYRPLGLCGDGSIRDCCKTQLRPPPSGLATSEHPVATAISRLSGPSQVACS